MSYQENNAVIGKELSDNFFDKGTFESGRITPKPASTTVAGAAKLADADTTAAGASDTTATTPAGIAAALNSTATPGGNVMQKAVANALEQSIAGDDGAQSAITAAIADNLAADTAFQSALAATIADDLPEATDTVKGVVTLGVAANFPSTSDEEAATPAMINAYNASLDLVLAGIDDVKYINSADLSGALQKGANYPINVAAPITAKVFYGDMFIGPDTRVNDIGVPGTAGFGQGICPKPPAGMMPLSNGTFVRGDKDYGNYIDASGSVMVWVPAFYYSIATNVVSIKSVYDYATEAAANAAGYALHRAFYDGTVQPGFFVDKYTCSNTGGVFASVRGGVPVDTDGSQSGVGAITGVGGVNNYGMVQQAAKSRGAAYHSASIFNYKAVAMLSLAHASASTSTVYCAWHDPAANFPKGCNSNTLADVNTTGLSFATAGHPTYPAKPLAGSGSQFAKTTHNGQESGISDINGTMWNVAFGLTSDGTNYFLLKPTVRLRDLTGSNATAANSFFGAAGLAANYDNVGTTIGALNGTNVYRPYGSTAQTLSGATSGTAWALTGAGVPIAVGGTNQFGNDGIWDYRPSDMCPLVGATWNYGSYAGVWALYLSGVRAAANNAVGGRAALYL